MKTSKRIILFSFLIILVVIFCSAVNADWQDNLIRSVKTSKKVVALTFDDGPDSRFTPQLLTILKQYNAKATFFLIGEQAEKYGDLVEQEVKEGHLVANHTLDHPRDLEHCSPLQVLEEIDGCEKILQQKIQQQPHYFRPPRGFIDLNTYRIVTGRNYKTILWTVSGDHHDAPTPEAMAERVLDVVQPGSIILLHDGNFYNRWKDVEAAKLILDKLTKKGYKFITVPELLALNKKGK